MHRVVWSQRALGDLVGIRDYVSEFAPMAARRLALRLIAAAESLSEHPLRGRSAGGGRRVLVAIPPYLIRYRIVGDRVEIITIRHGARRAGR